MTSSHLNTGTKRFRLIVIGDEILSGRRLDKHLSQLIALLTERGLSISQAEYVGDEPDLIVNVLKRSFASGDVVFSTGGIGATPDDHTRLSAAKALNVDISLHSQARELIAQRILMMADGDPIKSDLTSSDNLRRFKMGEFPVGSEIIPNPFNQIPGFSIKEHYFLPGFPVMAAPMMAWVLDTYYSHLFHLVDFVEKSFIVPLALEATLTPLMENIENSIPGVKVFSLPSVGDPSRSGVFARGHIELGVKGTRSLVDNAFEQLKLGVLSLGYEIHDLP